MRPCDQFAHARGGAGSTCYRNAPCPSTRHALTGRRHPPAAAAGSPRSPCSRPFPSSTGTPRPPTPARSPGCLPRPPAALGRGPVADVRSRARRAFELPKSTESEGTLPGGRRRELAGAGRETLAQRREHAGRCVVEVKSGGAGTRPPLAMSVARSSHVFSSPNPNTICSGTRAEARGGGGARAPSPCSESSRVIAARLVATSAQRIGPEQRGQFSRSAAKTWARSHAQRRRGADASSVSPSSSS